MRHKLYHLRKARGMSVNDLAKKAGLGPSTIRRIEDPTWPHKTHVQVAELIAEALGFKVKDIFHPMELSHVGRPPLTGGSYTVTETITVTRQLCGIHYIELSVTGACLLCDE